ncbi:nitroreductase family protein [Candidatus Woesearchaeota archaeon]|nr:nitroreductase family protein [Candidatus Woesearchaeota archaeon]
MDVKESIQKRRSVRAYKDRDVSDSLINELIEAARLAPSGNNIQPWKFFVVKNTETKKKLKTNKAFYNDFVYEASVIIICCADPNEYVKKKGRDSGNEMRAVRDLSLAAAFLVLRATELGLGTCFVGWIDQEKIKEVLNIPGHYIVPYVIPVGYPDGEPRYKETKGRDEIILQNQNI